MMSNRYDRDNYVVINWSNVESGELSFFCKLHSICIAMCEEHCGKTLRFLLATEFSTHCATVVELNATLCPVTRARR